MVDIKKYTAGKVVELLDEGTYEKQRGLIPQEFLSEAFLEDVAIIIRLGLRDTTDANVNGNLSQIILLKQLVEPFVWTEKFKGVVEKLLNLTSERIGAELYNSLDAEVRNDLHVRRRNNKAKKAEAVSTTNIVYN